MVPYPTNNIISVPFLTGQRAHVFLIRQAKMQLRSSTSPVEQQRSEAVSLAVWMHLSPPSIMHGLSPISVVVHTTGWLLGPQLWSLSPLWQWWLVWATKGQSCSALQQVRWEWDILLLFDITEQEKMLCASIVMSLAYVRTWSEEAGRGFSCFCCKAVAVNLWWYRYTTSEPCNEHKSYTYMCACAMVTS